MSNKIVPAAYRAIIDDVISSIKSEFDQFGVSEDVLADLQNRWEEKVVASNVADFDPPSAPQSQAYQQPPPQNASGSVPLPPNPFAGQTVPYTAYTTTTSNGVSVKSEPTENRISYGQVPQYLPPLPGPQLMNGRGPILPPLAFPTGPGTRAPLPRIPQSDGPSGMSIPQADGPSSTKSEDSATPPPRSVHPSLPIPAVKAEPLSEEINSDLDDTDDEAEEDEDAVAHHGPEVDIVFCTYDKVARVKNKWKCVLRDGMIHLNGKDYLFSKCTGEFEW